MILKTYTKNVYCVVLSLFACITTAQVAQQKVGNNPGTLNSSAVLELESTTKGFLPPRMTTTQMRAIVNPSEGLLVYDISTNCLKIFANGNWTGCLSNVLNLGNLSGLSCSSATHSGVLASGIAASGVSSVISYVGGNSGSYTAQSVASTGVTGLTAGLTAGIFANGSGSVTYSITGTPSGRGIANFAISLGGQSCTIIRQVLCGVYVSSGVYKGFSCYNLGADASLNPNFPVQGIHGNYYQWGRNTVGADASTAPGNIVGWDTTSAASGSWSDTSKTANDPCPSGFRVPTSAQWDGVVANNMVSRTGTWMDSATNFGSAIHFGPNTSTKWLTLPAAGYRLSTDGSLINRGAIGRYWSSTESSNARYLYFDGSSAYMNTTSNRAGSFSVRCISE